MTAYKPGDKIEYLSIDGRWKTLGAYLATSSDSTVVCEDDGVINWAESNIETRLARDTITVTVEIDRAAAEEVAAFANDGTSGKARAQTFRAFIDACAEAVRP